MDISKILFGQINTEKITSSFEELDINSDNVINDKDLSLTTDKNLQSQIMAILDSVDEEPALSPNAQPLSYLTDSGNSFSTDNLLFLENKLTSRMEDQKKLEEELEKKQEEYELLVAKINDDPGAENISSLKNRAEDLKSQISLLGLKIENIQNEFSILQMQYLSEEKVVNIQKAAAQNAGSFLSTDSKASADSTSETGTTTGTDITDWSKLSIEGKGINIANIAKVIYDSYTATGAKSSKAAFNEILSNGSDEEKVALLKLVNYPTKNTSYPIERKFSSLFSRPNITSEAAVIAKLASLDRDGDGFLSDDDISKITNNKYDHLFGIKEDGSLGCCGDCAAHFRNFSITTVNGKKCYCIGGQNGSITLTEDEYKALDEYYIANGSKASYQGALEAMSITDTETYSQNKSGNYSKEYCLYTGASGITSQIYSGRKSQNYQTVQQDKNLWYAYMALKYKIK